MNSAANDLFLVPFDFTVVTESALKYAISLARTTNGRVLLTHIVKDEEDIPAAETKIIEKLEELDPADRELVNIKVMEGSIFKDIAKTAESSNASMIIMGAHQASGFQKLFGSNALKMVESASVPFLILKDFRDNAEIKNIVLPFSFAKESLQIVEFAGSVASKFGGKVHLVGYKDKDEWLARDMRTNEVVVRKYLTEAKVNYELVPIAAGADYEKELLDYAKKIDADLIAAAYFSTGIKALFHKFLQAMLDNEYKIPVLTINAVEVMAVNSSYSFLTV